MSLYLDTSIVVPLFVSEPHTARARAILSAGSKLIVSDLTAAEFASAISHLVRMQLMDADAAGIAFANFDSWIGQAATRVRLTAVDMRSTESMLRTLNTPLRRLWTITTTLRSPARPDRVARFRIEWIVDDLEAGPVCTESGIRRTQRHSATPPPNAIHLFFEVP